MKKNLLTLAISTLFSLILLEIGLRIFAGSQIPVKDHRNDMFWEGSREFGWTNKPNSKGNFSNGLYNGYVVYDRYGNRQNSDEGTYVEGYENIFFIGDSTTESLEVNNDETVPAFLENSLRSTGRKVNVLNFGVRGYGTDQSVRKALHFAEQYKPRQIIYMYVDNDFIDNNTIKHPYAKYGKGVYVRRRGDSEFEAFNYPVPPYESTTAALVVFDPEGYPFIHQVSLPEKDLEFREKRDRFKVALKKHVYILRAISYVRGLSMHNVKVAMSPAAIRDIDPYEMIKNGESWSEQFSISYVDGSKVRMKQKAYFGDQMKFLLSQLRMIDSVEQVHLIWFPSVNEMALFKEGRSANHELFDELQKTGVVNSYVNLNSVVIDKKVDVVNLRSQADHHFSKKGNAWIVDQLLEQIQF
jgi:hypothetical protein